MTSKKARGPCQIKIGCNWRPESDVMFLNPKQLFLYRFFSIQTKNGNFPSSRNDVAVSKEIVMIEKNSARFLIGALNLLAVGSPLLTSQVAHAATIDQKIEKLNVASLNSIESSWLKVPMACKARGFNASPVSLENKEISSYIQNIYASYEA
jgi:hypothetical protein